MTTTTSERLDAGADTSSPRGLTIRKGPSDRIFDGITSTSGLLVLVFMGAVGLFLTLEALQSLEAVGASFLTETSWEPDRGEFGIASVLLYTVLIALVAVAIALPISVATALFIAEVAPTRSR